MLLEIKNLNKSFGENKILNNINFCVDKSQVLVILGSSGCGKSTLLRCINGLENIDSGDIILDDEKINYANTKWNLIRQRIGMVFQNYELFPHLNVLENIILAPTKIQKRQKDEVIKQAQNLLHRFNLIDKKLFSPSALSGGQKQRVAIIRALCMNPEIILFDEVTASLDPEMSYEVSNLILELAKDGMTMIIVTHEMKFAKSIATDVMFLEKGTIQEYSPVREFFNNTKNARVKNFLNIFDNV